MRTPTIGESETPRGYFNRAHEQRAKYGFRAIETLEAIQRRFAWDTLRRSEPVSNWAIRTIRVGGRVKIGTRWYRVSEKHQPYDGHLDGMRYAFGRYHTGKRWEPFVFLWGTEESYHAIARGEDFEYGPEVMPDGGLPWEWWNEEAAPS